MKSAHVVCLALTLQFVALPSARAQHVYPSVAEAWSEVVRPQIAEILARAQQAERDGDMNAALEAYQEANLRGECTAVGVELGLAYLRAGRTVEGARTLRYALLYSPLPLSPRPESEIKDKLKEAKEKVGTLIVRASVDKVSLEIDGAYRWEYPLLTEIYVDPEKEHKITARKEGYWTAFTTERVGAGELKEVLMAMEPQVMQKIVNLPTRVMASVGSGPAEPPAWPRTLMIAGSVGLGVSLTLGLSGVYLAATSEKQSDGYTMGSGMIIGGAIGLGLSLTAIGVGIASTPPPPQPIITISPALAKNQVGLGLSGAW